MVIAIDGPGGSGKSTVAAAVAERLGIERLDTGAMFRSVALAALRRGLAPDDAAAMGSLAARLEISVDGSKVALDGEDVSDAIRTPEVTRAASAVAVHPAVRAELRARQRSWMEGRGSGVVEGRDIGTVVFPQADVKVYLTADPAERARRRSAELARAMSATEERPVEGTSVAAELARRDLDDATRTTSPLDVAPGAVVIDTTGKPVDQVTAEVLALVGPDPASSATPVPSSPGTAVRPSPATPVPSSPGTPVRSSTRRHRHAPPLVAPTPAARWFYGLARFVVYLVCRGLWRVTIEGTERVPPTGAFIVSPVHRSNVDTMLMSAVTRRRLSYLAKDSLWRWRPLGWLFSALGGFPVRRGIADREALRRCEQILRSGQPLVVFPEGTRRSGPVVEHLFEGAAYLALRTRVSIVPIGIGGSEGALPRGATVPARVRIHMIVGEPIPPPVPTGTPSRVHRHDVSALSEELRQRLQALFDQAQQRAQGL